MKKYFSLLATIFFATLVQAQVFDTAQSLPNHSWQTISNEFVKVIYPEVMKNEAVYIANLIEHYSKYVGKTYGIEKPEKLSLILRPDNSDPNGFVTLAPRRSEWYASTMFTPYVGSTDWFQVLSIHEYRHVMQYDHYNRRTVKFLYYIMGDGGRSLATFLALPSWYNEGDAVWAETKYTDAGRGRSPRFLARLKALVLRDQIPTYDQFLNGSYSTELPNQYVYGYALISYATQKFGENIWQKITDDVALFPNPFRLYTSFENITGQSFESFYNETMNDLKSKWSKDAPLSLKTEEFRDQISATQINDTVYYVERTLDSLPSIVVEKSGQRKTLAKLPFIKEISWIQFGKTKAVYTEFNSNPRFDFAGSSDIIIVDLQSGKTKRLTEHRRFYNPSFNLSQNKILATEFTIDQKWVLVELDLNGKVLQQVGIPNHKVVQGVYLDDKNAVAILNGQTGLKSLVTVNLQTHQVTQTLLAPSHNLLNAISVDAKKNILFEAQYKGATDIFALNSSFALFRCTNSKIAAFTPTSDGQHLFYSDSDVNGAIYKKINLSECKSFSNSELINFNYLGDNPSDNYNKFPLQSFPEQDQLFTKNLANYKAEEYGDFVQQLLIPHTWGLLLGRGFSLGLQTDNYLRTLSFAALTGSDSEEGTNFSAVELSLKKYYPLIGLKLENRQREVTNLETVSTVKAWTENNALVSMIIPYRHNYNIYSTFASLSFEGGYTDTSNYKLNKVDYSDSNYFYKSSAQFSFAWQQNPAPRSIMAPWLLSYSIRSDKAEKPKDSSLNSNRVLHQATLQTPSLFKHDGFTFNYSQQNQTGSNLAYRFAPESSAIDYVFSRGYTYKDVTVFKKTSANYFFPLIEPDLTLGGFYYLKRSYANLFFDSTVVDSSLVNSTLNSYGAELLLESKVFRILPLTFGVRVGQKDLDKKSFSEGFLATKLGF